jgi:hypothetical protein
MLDKLIIINQQKLRSHKNMSKNKHQIKPQILKRTKKDKKEIKKSNQIFQMIITKNQFIIKTSHLYLSLKKFQKRLNIPNEFLYLLIISNFSYSLF